MKDFSIQHMGLTGLIVLLSFLPIKPAEIRKHYAMPWYTKLGHTIALSASCIATAMPFITQVPLNAFRAQQSSAYNWLTKNRFLIGFSGLCGIGHYAWRWRNFKQCVADGRSYKSPILIPSTSELQEIDHKTSSMESDVMRQWQRGTALSAEDMRDSYNQQVLRLEKNSSKSCDKSPGTMRIMSYNIHSMRDVYGNDSESRLYQYFNIMKPDLIAVQEVGRRRWNNLSNHLKNNCGLQEQIGWYRRWLWCVGNLMAARVGPKIIASAAQNFSNVLDRGYVRMELPVRLSSTNSTVQLVAYGTHLSVEGPDSGSRSQQIEHLLKLAEKDVKENKQVIIMGDFNAVSRDNYDDTQWKTIQTMYAARPAKQRIALQSTVLETLKTAGFVDCFAKQRLTAPLWTTWNGTRVDWIQVSENWNIPIKNCFAAYTTSSDHLPIIMDIEAEIVQR